MAQRPMADASSLPPLVFISYSHGDEQWRTRLDRFLQPSAHAGLISIWHSDEKLGDGAAKFEKVMSSAALAVVLLSDNYLSSPSIMSREAPLLGKLASAKKLGIVSILVRDCDWKRLNWTDYELRSADVPLEKLSRPEQDKILRDAAQRIVELAGARRRPKTGFSAGTVDPGAGSGIAGASAGTGSGSSAPDIPGPPGGTVDPGAGSGDITGAPAGTGSGSPDMPGPPGGTVDQQAGPPGNEPYSTRLNVDAVSKLGLSTEARELLRRAQVLATFGKDREPQVTTSCLLFAIAESGRDQLSTFPSRQFLWRQLQRADATAYGRIFRDRFPRALYRGTDEIINFDSTDAPAQSITPNVFRVFDQARALIIPSSPPSPVEAVHILGSLLINEETKAFGRLSQIVDVTQLRAELLNFVARSFPHEDLEAWQKSLGGEASAPVGEAPEPREPDDDFSAPLAGFAADFWKGEDLLDITRDVNALASLAAATSIDPPLSIGLFGDWGSGKSHFMRQMRARVEKLSLKARESGKPQSELGYHQRIVQIEFNAWHYIEGNLWASLVEHIFNNLKFTDEQDGESHVEDARLAIMEKLELKQELQKKLEARQQVLQGKAKEAEQRVEAANAKRDDTSEELTKLRQKKEHAVNELPQVTLNKPEVELLMRLGLPEGALHLPAEIQKKYHEAQTFWGGIRTQWNVFRSDPGQLNKLVRIALVIAAVALVGWFFRNVWKSAYAYVASIVTFLVGAWAAAKPYLEKFKKSMVALKEKYDQVEKERQKKIIALESEVTSLTTEMATADNEAKAINAEVVKLQVELETTDAGKLLADFIEDRAACSDYRRHLGVLALIRRDFEKLSQLLSEQSSGNGSSAAAEKTVSRIILYVDDLDRCPPKNVVQVLQAIHLLLAFPLFVVIVGVDARWVTRSLQESYEWLAADEAGEAPDQRKPDEGDDNVVVTPHDYLEKIFQIPFWLKPMGDTECRNLLIGLTNNSRAANPQNGGDSQATIEPSPANATDVSSVTNQADDQESSASLMPVQPPQVGAQSQVTSTSSEVQSAPAIDSEPSNLNQNVTADQSAVELKAEEKIDLAPKSLGAD